MSFQKPACACLQTVSGQLADRHFGRKNLVTKLDLGVILTIIKHFTMKQILLLATVLFTFFSFGQKNSGQGKNLPSEFNKIKYDKVIAYELDNKIKGFVVSDGLLNTKIIKNQKELTQSQIDSLQKFLSLTKKTKKRFGIECYNQHSLGIVYYLNDKIVANFSVSPTCNLFMLYTKNLTDPNDNYSKTTINYYYFNTMTFVENGQKKLQEFCADLNF